MSAWSKRRKYVYGSTVGVIAAVLIIVPVYRYIIYHQPTCFDGIKNGDEIGVDCGGSCQKLCPSSFNAPIVDWARYDKRAPNVYNLAAYIENNNTEVSASNVPYTMTLYDAKGIPITEAKGTVTLPPHRNTLAFLPAVSTGAAIPATSLFYFTADPNWVKQSDPLAKLVVLNKNYYEDTTGSHFQVTLQNNGALPLKHIAVSVVLWDVNGNAVGFSKTIIDQIAAGKTAVAPFTWPEVHNGAVVSEEVLPVAE